MRDVLFLAKPSVPATPADKQTALDLLDTLKHNEDACVGMAANMIAVPETEAEVYRMDCPDYSA